MTTTTTKSANWQHQAITLHNTQLFSWREIATKVGEAKSTVSDYLRRSVELPEVAKHDNSRILVISDMHIPYSHPNLVEYLAMLKERYKPTRVISIGDECFPPEVEILTVEGFVRFDKLGDQRVAQWHDDGTVDFTDVIRKVVKPFSGNLVQYKHKTMTSRTTPKHNLVKLHPKTGVAHRREAWDSKGTESWHIPRAGKLDGIGVELKDDEIRLMVAFQADGCFTKGAARFMFTKERKSTRLLALLQSCEVKYNTHTLSGGGYQYYVEVSNVPNYFTKAFDIPIEQYSLAQREVFVRELEHWDGTKVSGGIRYVSKVISNVEYVASMAVLSGYGAGKVGETNESNYIDLRWNREKTSLITAKKSDIEYEGDVYCVTVPSGMIIVRTDGDISVSGNCDKHALSFHDSDPDLLSAGAELQASLPIIATIHSMFPEMDIIDSNHGSMVHRKAKHHGIPRHYIKSYNDVLEVGEGWKWHNDLTVELPNGQKVYFHHGKSADGLKLSQTMGMSCVQGHYHEKFGINYWGNSLGLYFSMQVGCLIDDSSYAFAYNNVNLKRPVIGTGLIINGIPILEAMPL